MDDTTIPGESRDAMAGMSKRRAQETQERARELLQVGEVPRARRLYGQAWQEWARVARYASSEEDRQEAEEAMGNIRLRGEVIELRRRLLAIIEALRGQGVGAAVAAGISVSDLVPALEELWEHDSLLELAARLMIDQEEASRSSAG